MNFKSYLSLGAASVAVLMGASAVKAQQIAPGVIQFDSLGGGAFYGNNFVDFSAPGTPSVPTPGVDAPIEISSVPFTDGAFAFLADSEADISDLPALPFLIEDNVLYTFADIPSVGGPLVGFLNDFDAAPGLKFDLDAIQRTSDASLGRVQFNLDGEFNGGGFDPTPVTFQFSLLTAQIPPSAADFDQLAFYDPSVVGPFPNAQTSPGLNSPFVNDNGTPGDDSDDFIDGTPCTGSSCITGFNSYSGQLATETSAVPEPSSMLGLFTLIGLGGLLKVKAKK